MRCARRHEPHFILRLQGAIDHPHQHYDAHIVIKPRVDNQCLEGCLRVSDRGRNLGNHLLQNIVDTDTGLGAGFDRFGGIDADHIFDFGPSIIRVG